MISHFKITCLLLVVIEGAACVHKHSNGVIIPSKECIELNNKGGEYLQKFPYNEKDINEAINLLRQ